MVLAASTRRDGLSLAGLARTEIGRPAGLAAAIAILYIVIIALAGLGIVVVKALGGEQVPMKAGTVLDLSRGRSDRAEYTSRRAQHLQGPGGLDLPFRRPSPKRPWSFTRRSTWRFPRTCRHKTDSTGKGMVLPRRRRRGWCRAARGARSRSRARFRSRSLSAGTCTGCGRGKILEASLIGAALVLAATVAGVLIPGLEARAVLFRFRATRRFCPGGLWIRRGRAAGVALALPARLPFDVPQDRHHLAVGRRGLDRQSQAQCAGVQPVFFVRRRPQSRWAVFPYVFICIMCGAISGFHALVASGTTPKMVDRESHVRMIGYGAMLMEGLVGVVALIAAAALPNSMYYDINIPLARRPEFLAKHHDFAQSLETEAAAPAAAERGSRQPGSELAAMEKDVQESLHGRTGGAVTLAVGMARIFSDALPGMSWMLPYWYHFAIMFEALFILTTIDAGTRIARFLVQEFLGRIWKPLGDLHWWPAALLATGLVVFGWGYFIYTGSVETIWPMFGMANQLLAVIALAVVTTILFNTGRGRYAPVTLLPMLFVATTTTTTAYYEIYGRFWTKMVHGDPPEPVRGWLNIGLTVMLLVCVVVIVGSAILRWMKPARAGGELSELKI